MAVRVEKPAFNLRDKLSKLELPVGVHGSQVLKSETPQDTFNIVSAGRKNMIINGDMRISQRYSGAQTISSGTNTYHLDRWLSRDDTGATVAQSHSSTSPDGHYRSLRLECTNADTSLTGTEYCRIQHYIEGYNILLDWGQGRYTDFATISFWVMSGVTGTYSVSIEDGDASTVCINEYQINRPNVWEWKTVTVPPPLNGDFVAKQSSNGLRVTFTLATTDQYKTTLNQLNKWDSSGDYDMAGPNQVNFVRETGNFYLSGVQLERGKVATPFEYMRYQEQLALCQRYFETINLYGAHSNYTGGGYNRHTGEVFWKVEKRATPTTNTPSVGNYQPGGGSGTVSISGPTINGGVLNTGNTNQTYPDGWINSGAVLHIDAEL